MENLQNDKILPEKQISDRLEYIYQVWKKISVFNSKPLTIDEFASYLSNNYDDSLLTNHVHVDSLEKIVVILNTYTLCLAPKEFIEEEFFEVLLGSEIDLYDKRNRSIIQIVISFLKQNFSKKSEEVVMNYKNLKLRILECLEDNINDDLSKDAFRIVGEIRIYLHRKIFKSESLEIDEEFVDRISSQLGYNLHDYFDRCSIDAVKYFYDLKYID